MNIWQFITDIIIVTFLGLFIAFSPMLIMVNLLIVLKSKRPILHAVALILGIITPLLIVAWIGLQFINPDSQISISSISASLQIPPLIDISFGLALFGVAIKQMLKPPELFAKASEFKIPTDTFGAMFAFGFMKSLLSATNLFAILVMVKLIIESSLNPMLDLIILLWTLAVGLIPFAIVLYYHRFRKGYLLKLNKKLNEIMARNLRRVVIVGLYAVATMFTLAGLYELFTR